MDSDILHHQVVMVHTVWLTQCCKASMHSTHWLVLCLQLHHVLPHYITQLHHPIYVVIVQHLTDII